MDRCSIRWLKLSLLLSQRDHCLPHLLPRLLRADTQVDQCRSRRQFPNHRELFDIDSVMKINRNFSFRTGADWAVPQSSKLKFTQLFNTLDKTRCGFLTGTQARGILLQSKVPQQTLAQIWSMSDRDADGRLGCEEFVLALYLCEMVVSGKPLPAELPLELIPPSFRKPVSRHGSVANSRHGSVSSQGNVSTHGDFDPALGMSQGKKLKRVVVVKFHNFS